MAAGNPRRPLPNSQKLLLLKQLEAEGKLPSAQILTPHMSERMSDSGTIINRYLQKVTNARTSVTRA
jgi:hypothetical protein